VGHQKEPTRGRELPLLRADGFARPRWLIHGFTTRCGGVSDAYGGHTLNLGYTKHDTHSAVDENRALLLRSLGAMNAEGKPWPLVRLRQIHSDIIHRVDHLPEQLLPGDGLVTDSPRLFLAVQTADCLPVIVVDAKRKAVGAFHAGWRGTVARIVEKGVGAMRLHFGSAPEDLRAAIGPGIASCCYAVGEEVRDRFQAQFAYGDDLFREVTESDPVHERYPLLFMTARAPGHSEAGRTLHLDLREANRRQLLDAGLAEANITALNFCTACRSDLFFSHRAEKGMTGRQMGVVGIKDL
jgi:purine-nucleoside/S-methyl-5'-thioadenosine phosphorylase / adenosine deaminase